MWVVWSSYFTCPAIGTILIAVNIFGRCQTESNAPHFVLMFCCCKRSSPFNLQLV